MINRTKLNAVVAAYKQQFAQRWPNERFKWEAIQHFQTHWDLEAPYIEAMITQAMEKSHKMLIAARFFPLGMLEGFSRREPETMRTMFRTLFDESQPVEKRIAYFMEKSEETVKKYWYAGAQHYQHANPISIYLWLRYPDKYYIYKFTEFLDVAKALDSDFVPKRGDNEHNLINGFRMYDEIAAALAEDQELVQMMQRALTPDCYPDTALRTLTVDVGFFISREYNKTSDQTPSTTSDAWWPTDYSPNISTDQWLTLLQNPSVFTRSSLAIMHRFMDQGGAATCSDLAKIYGQKTNFYNTGISTLAQRVHTLTNCPKPPDTPNAKWWPIVCLGRQVDTKNNGVYEWRLRPELQEALSRTDLSHIDLYDPSEPRFWWLDVTTSAPTFATLAIGDTFTCTALDAHGNPRGMQQHFEDVKFDEFVLCYTSAPTPRIVGLAKIAQDFDGTAITLTKRKAYDKAFDDQLFTTTPVLDDCEYVHIESATLYHLREPEYDALIAYIDGTAKPQTTPVVVRPPAYTDADFLREVYLAADDLATLKALLTHKHNLILQGAPGVGKTFAAKRLAYAIMGAKDDTRMLSVQFHQNSSYEDFVMGYRPHDDGFALEYGAFYAMCQRASNDPAQPYFVIIDEINRGNISKIFGELLMLIEHDYRGTAMTLTYDKQPFAVPQNLYIIGMMNTADRSLALIDYALRRRFSFFEMQPGFTTDGFGQYQHSLNSRAFDELIAALKALNTDIASDPALGTGFRIGHSSVCNLSSTNLTQRLGQIVEYDIIPLLREYWFDDQAKVDQWAQRLKGAVRG